jgi:hypothetical protein
LDGTFGFLLAEAALVVAGGTAGAAWLVVSGVLLHPVKKPARDIRMIPIGQETFIAVRFIVVNLLSSGAGYGRHTLPGLLRFILNVQALPNH